MVKTRSASAGTNWCCNEIAVEMKPRPRSISALISRARSVGLTPSAVRKNNSSFSINLKRASAWLTAEGERPISSAAPAMDPRFMIARKMTSRFRSKLRKLTMKLPQKANNRQRHLRHERDKQKDHDHHSQHRQERTGNLANPQPTNRRPDKDRVAERRDRHSNREIDRNHRTELHRVHAKLLSDRDQE